MKQLILDHFRRKAWILALCAALEILTVCGSTWLVARHPDRHSVNLFTLLLYSARSDRHISHLLTSIQILIALLIALFMGAIMLAFDLGGGVVRTFASLPLSARQIGRAWWLATVGIPAIAIAALLLLCSGIFHFFHPDTAFPAGSLAVTSLLILLLFGVGFVSILKCASGFDGNWRERFGGFWGLMIPLALCLLFEGLLKSSITVAILCGFGVLITIGGWFRAGQLVSGCANLRLAGLEPKILRGRHRAAGGYGGIPRLLAGTFTRAFLIVLAMVVAMALQMALLGQIKSWHRFGEYIPLASRYMPFWFFILFLFIPVLWELRILRTLPMSATTLTAVMFAIVILPVVALGGVMAGVAQLISGTPAAVAVLEDFAFTLAPAAVCVFFAVWKGDGIQAYAFLFMIMLGYHTASFWTVLFFHHWDIPLILSGATVTISVALAFLFTRRTLIQSSHTYRVRANRFGNALSGMPR